MFKLVILSMLMVGTFAAPGFLDHSSVLLTAPATTVVHEPALAKVGALIKSYPTAVSHQSFSQVHSAAHVVQPLVAPIVKTTVATAPIVYQAAPVYAKTLVAPATAYHITAPASLHGHDWASSW